MFKDMKLGQTLGDGNRESRALKRGRKSGARRAVTGGHYKKKKKKVQKDRQEGRREQGNLDYLFSNCNQRVSVCLLALFLREGRTQYNFPRQGLPTWPWLGWNLLYTTRLVSNAPAS